MRRRKAGVTLVEVTAGVTLLGIVVALVIPAITRSSRFQKVLECRGHLRDMHQAQAKLPAPGPKELGGAYWTRLASANPPLVSADKLRCPLYSAATSSGCDYLGPAEDPAKIGEKDPIGADAAHNHSDDGKEGGNVLLKSGEVVTDRTGIWGSAGRRCRP
jgi:hypothetical protein